MSPIDFLTKTKSNWPRFTDEQFPQSTDEERATLRAIEARAIDTEFEALSDIIVNCRNKYRFAKTYKLLRTDLEKTIAKAKHAEVGLPAESKAAIRVVVNVIERKLAYLADWFYIALATEGDRQHCTAGGGMRIDAAIERYAGKSSQSGCLLFLLAGLAVIATGIGFSIFGAVALGR